MEIAEDRADFESVCPKCSKIINETPRAFIEPKSFVTSSDKPNGQDPGLTRLRPAPAQEARLLSAADEAEFLLRPSNVPLTSWAWQNAKQGRMFIVNKGRGSGFLRCSCGYTKLLRKPQDEHQERQRQHKTPFNQPCAAPFWHGREDLAHEFRTDVLQVRADHALPMPVELAAEDVAEWHERFTRTLAEAVRRGATVLLGIEPRELAATVRARLFGYPEVILYDTVAGGAGYCRMLLDRHSMRELLAAARDALNCRADCTHACRVCLQDYDNQRVWDKLDRQPVLNWLKRLLGAEQPVNPYARFNAAPLEVRDGMPLLLAELERADHIVAVAPTLFSAQAEDESRADFLAPETRLLVRRLVAWLASAEGRRLEIALAHSPVFSTEVSGSLALWHELQPRLADGGLKFWKLPRSFDASSWPRALTNPGRTGSAAWFTPVGAGAAFLNQPLPAPLWKSPGLAGEALSALRAGWEEIKVAAPAKPSDLTLREYRAGEPRDLKRDFAFCHEQAFALLQIEDPFVIKADWQYRSLRRLLGELSKLWQKWPTRIELKTRDEGGSEQARLIEDLEDFLKPHGVVLKVRRIAATAAHGARRPDFHDRRLVFYPDLANARRRVTVLLTGGIDRYLKDGVECGIITHRTA